jgi:hypothetical protein
MVSPYARNGAGIQHDFILQIVIVRLDPRHVLVLNSVYMKGNAFRLVVAIDYLGKWCLSNRWGATRITTRVLESGNRSLDWIRAKAP